MVTNGNEKMLQLVPEPLPLRIFGLNKGQIIIADNFDAPLDDFKDLYLANYQCGQRFRCILRNKALVTSQPQLFPANFPYNTVQSALNIFSNRAMCVMKNKKSDSRPDYLFETIEQQHQKRNRYEIDLDLLKVGYNPRDIDATWQKLLQPTKPLAYLKPKVHIKYVGVVGLIVAHTILLYFLFRPFPLDSLPDYPGGTPLKSDIAIPEGLLETSWGSLYEETAGTKITQYRIFVTNDPAPAIRSFYLAAARTAKLKETTLIPNKLVCFVQSENQFWADPPMTGMQVLEQTDPKEAALIMQLVPQATPNTKLIVLMQGFWHHYQPDGLD